MQKFRHIGELKEIKDKLKIGAMNKMITKERIITLLRKDDELRREIVKILIEESDIVTKTYLDIQLAKLAKEFNEKLTEQSKEFDRKLTEQSREFDRKLEAMAERLAKEFNERLAEQSKEFDRKLAEQSKEFDRKLTELGKEFDRKLTEQSREFDRKLEKQSRILMRAFEDRILALGGRWGIQNEIALREGMRAILSEEFNAKVKHWHYRKKIPAIHPRRGEYELDIIISDGKVIVIEIKSSVYREQVEAFMDNVRAYEYVKKRKVDRKMIISAYIDPGARKLAKREGIEIKTPPLEYYERTDEFKFE